MNQDDGVRAYFLINGMEILGNFDKEDDNYIYLKDAVCLTLRPSENGKGHVLNMMPPSIYGQLGKSGSMDLPLAKTSIAFPFKPNDEVYQNYCNATGKIVVAQAIIR